MNAIENNHTDIALFLIKSGCSVDIGDNVGCSTTAQSNLCCFTFYNELLKRHSLATT